MTKELKADLWLLSVTVVWGASFPIMSIVLKDIPPYTFLALRYSIAGIILALLSCRKLKRINWSIIKSGGLIGISLLLGAALQIVGLLYTTPSKSGFITGINVAFVPIFIAIIYKKLPDIKTVLGVVLSIAGLSIMSISGSFQINFGDMLTLASAVCFAVQILLVDRLAKEIDAMLLTTVELLVVGGISFIPGVIVEGLSVNINALSIGAVLFTALFCTIYAYGIQNKMQPFTKPAHAAIIFLAEPVFSAIFSVLVGDRLTGKTLLGCILIFLGMIIIELKIKPRWKKKEETNENIIL